VSSNEAKKTGRFKPVNTHTRFTELEEEILAFWQENDIQNRSESERPKDKPFVFYEGPPTANGTPGIHHVLGRVLKDLIPRYKTMQGFRCFRKGGWDTHGLPVELEIEKELGLATKREIEEYGIALFNQHCRESVFRYVKDWTSLTQRIGFWIDMGNPYITCENDYIETCWWIIKELWDRELVYRDMKGTPHCPRCVTSLSSHEVSLGYQEDTPDPSIYIKFRFLGASTKHNTTIFKKLFLQDGVGTIPTYMLAWTTTPWTLPGNVALAVNANAHYCLIETSHSGQRERLVLSESLLESAVTDEYQILEKFRGEELVGLQYEPLYDPLRSEVDVLQFKSTKSESTGNSITELVNVETFQPSIISADFVSLDDGTGVVHIAPAFGDEDLNVGRANELYFVQHVDLQGVITGAYPFAGKFVKDADKDILSDLQERSLLYRRGIIHHTYPFCWRCDTPLLYYAKASWYIRTTAIKNRLISGNEEINWYPGHIKQGRFGEWLRNNVDWAISRERFWGTPLPIWQCHNCQEYLCIGSKADLTKHLRDGEIPEDLHRPYIDAVKLGCPNCNGEMSRMPDVLDAWFDSGAMPFAQWHYPFENKEPIDLRQFFPADYICEMVEQTRGWFYSLHAISTLLKGEPCYRNVIGHGVILDDNGEKMSKSRGNVIDPWAVINTHGADAIRWYLLTATAPGNARRFSAELVSDASRRFIIPLWNVYSFFVTYANIDQFEPKHTSQIKPTSSLDQWLNSELQILVRDVTELLDNYNTTEPGRRIQEFVESLSNWYVRRSRRRFWKSENDDDKLSAYNTLYDCLVTLSRLLAPFTPFLAEALYQNLVRSTDTNAPTSVHLDRWPIAELSQIDHLLSDETKLAMRIARLGRAARSKAKVKVRQPLQRVFVRTRTAMEDKALLSQIKNQIQEELNVKEIHILVEDAEVVEFEVQPNRERLGPKYGKDLQNIITALAKANPQKIAGQIESGNELEVGDFLLLPEEVNILLQDKPGYSVISEGGYIVALDANITAELAQEGLARELVHRIQNMRRSANLNIDDHITLTYLGEIDLEAVFDTFQDYIQSETLTDLLSKGEPPTKNYIEQLTIDNLNITIGIAIA
jgi:isoleucyl-tRNA synthetase